MLPSDTQWALIGFQASAFSHADTVSFTLNLTVSPKRQWAMAREKWAYLEEKPVVGMIYAVLDGDESVIWTARIDELLPPDFRARQGWMGWVVDEGEAPSTVAAEVVDAIRDYALPSMRSRMT